MNRDYIKIGKTRILPDSTNRQRELENNDWKELVFYHLLTFYKSYNQDKLQQLILDEEKKANPRKEREIAKFIRKHLKNNRLFSFQGFKAPGEVTNDEDIEGNYDILIIHSFWQDEFSFECKNLEEKQSLVNKYVYDKIYPKTGVKNDGGVYRHFNGKYAQSQNFGGMIGFVLKGDIQNIKTKIYKKLETKFDVSPDGDLIKIIENSIETNNFTFDSIHTRFDKEFTIHHLLFDFNSK
jgi:hypothetical protein